MQVGEGVGNGEDGRKWAKEMGWEIEWKRNGKRKDGEWKRK